MSEKKSCLGRLLDKLPNNVRPIVTWENPVKSAIAMVAGLTILLSLGCLSMISVFAYSCLAVLCCTAAWRVYHDVIGSKKTDPTTAPHNPFKGWLADDVAVPRDRVHEYVNSALDYSSDFLNYLKHALLVENYLDSLKFGLYMYMLSILGGFFNLITLVTVAFVLLFVLSKPYLMYQTKIDGALNKAQAKLDELSDKAKALMEKVPGLRKQKTT